MLPTGHGLYKCDNLLQNYPDGRTCRKLDKSSSIIPLVMLSSKN